MNYIEYLSLSSPWWKDKGWYKKDRNIISAQKSAISFRHIKRYKLNYHSVDIIRGPRQIGKTTEIKLLIRDMLNEGKNPRAIAYFICEIISKHKELFEVLKTFYHHLKLNKIKNGIIFLDEVSSIKDWQKAVKSFVDMGMGRNIHIVVTGSSSIELKRGYERMPGRRNGGRDFLFLPMGFDKFCLLTNSKKSIHKVKFTDILKSSEKFEKFRQDILTESDFYKKCLADYMKIGGFPKAVSDFVRYREISEETLTIYQSVLFSEFEKYRKSIMTLIHIMVEIERNLANSISYNTIMRNTGLSSADTVKEYVEMLSRAYLGLHIFCVDISRKRIFNKKDKKIYLIDPVIFRILQEKFHVRLPDEGKIAENFVAVQTGRFFLKDWADKGILEKLYYWKSSKGKEVDFVIFLKSKPFGIEVKYQNIISRWDEISIRKGIGKGIIITKDTFEWGEVPKIPLWAFLLFDMC